MSVLANSVRPLCQSSYQQLVRRARVVELEMK